MRNEVADLDWSAGRSVPAFQTPLHLAIYDIRGATPEIQLAVSTLVGLINRPQPRVYLVNGDDETTWLQLALQDVACNRASVSGNDVLDALLTLYGAVIKGM